MTVSPATYDITIFKGADFTLKMVWNDENSDPIDLTNFTARLQARVHIKDSETFIDLTTENGGITLGGATGEIVLFMAAETTELIEAEEGVYDLEIITGGSPQTTTRLLQGGVVISADVTR